MRFFTVAFLVLLLTTSTTLAREWADKSEAYRIEAEFVKVEAGSAFFRKPNGKLCKCDVTLLRDEDQQVITQVTSGSGEAKPEQSAANDGTPSKATEATAVEVQAEVQFTAQVAEPPAKRTEVKFERRCAYLGRCGSFHLIGSGGTAAYQFGNQKYVADLAFFGQNEWYWYYVPAKEGDPFTA